ncbi:hypothetical protein F5148DRAFT_1371289 [Russula earlei]|uniref:Uncharacterized protein n=1 Tax=Russula earlei TaxID=71964 RepID=A0ACC0TTJ8_9AGAM|nr:hypothetical protein F5148DRAFT_1371289 [Russula earlei]
MSPPLCHQQHTPRHRDRIRLSAATLYIKMPAAPQPGFGAPNTERRDVSLRCSESAWRKIMCKPNSRRSSMTPPELLIASSYINPRTRIVVIFGLGCNAAYMERVGEIHKIKNLGIDDEAQMAINCEWILRLVICELINEGVLFLGQNTYKIGIPATRRRSCSWTIGIFTHFFALETTLAERQFFRALAKLVGRRATRPSACGIAAIVSKMGYLDAGYSVGADGSLYNKYPGFADRVHEGLQDIFGDKGRNIVTYHAEDGSGVGSAIIAAMTKIRKEKGLYLNV